MMKNVLNGHRRALMVLSILSLLGCERPTSAPIPPKPLPNNDALVVAVVLQDFGNWKEATFGELEGVLALDAQSHKLPYSDVAGVLAVAKSAAAHIDEALAQAYVTRNQAPVPIDSLVSRSRWARIRPPPPTDRPDWDLPNWAKATGSLGLPGYSTDGQRAMLQLHHSWSMHGAIVTYVLALKEGQWVVVVRDQAVFL